MVIAEALAAAGGEATALLRVARVLTPAERAPALPAMLAAARAMKFPPRRVEALEALLPMLDAGERRDVAVETLLAAGGHRDDDARAAALTALLRLLAPGAAAGDHRGDARGRVRHRR